MMDSTDKDNARSTREDKATTRAARLKAALKVNIARRKAQARARASDKGTNRQG